MSKLLQHIRAMRAGPSELRIVSDSDVETSRRVASFAASLQAKDGR